jgi:RimJ/RimL family protein N-acetyltransferase
MVQRADGSEGARAMTLFEEECPESRSSRSDRESCTPVLRTERLVLRAPRPQDVTAVAAIADDRRIAEMTASIPHPYRPTDAEAWIAHAKQTDRETTLLITLKDDTVIGGAGFVMREGPAPELGYWLGVPFWGEGYATEAARAVVDHAFCDHGFEALQAAARVVNPASRRVIEKCGFQWTGVGLTRIRALGSSVPVDRFRLEKHIWRALRAWGTTPVVTAFGRPH